MKILTIKTEISILTYIACRRGTDPSEVSFFTKFMLTCTNTIDSYTLINYTTYNKDEIAASLN